GDVAQEGPEIETLPAPDRRTDRNLDRKLIPVAVESRQLEGSAHDGGVAGFVEPPQSRQMRLAEWLGDDRLHEWAPNRFLAGPPEGGLRLSIPGGDASVRAHADESVMRRIDDETGELLAVGQFL